MYVHLGIKHLKRDLWKGTAKKRPMHLLHLLKMYSNSQPHQKLCNSIAFIDECMQPFQQKLTKLYYIHMTNILWSFAQKTNKLA